MITSICVSNFRSLGPETRLKLDALTVLVGPNGAGKSSLTDVFRFVAESLRNGIGPAIEKRGGIGSLRRWGYGRPFNLEIRIDARTKEGEGFWEVVVSGENRGDYRIKRERAFWGPVVGQVEYRVEGGLWRAGPKDMRPFVGSQAIVLPILADDKRFKGLADELRNPAVYSVFPDTLAAPQKPDPNRPMEEHGRNWCSVLADILKSEYRDEFVTALGAVTGDIDDCRVKMLGNHLVARFRHDSVTQPGGKYRERWFGSHQESDGTLRMAGILAALYQVPTPSLIGIEEPEQTIHPGALAILADYLKEASSRCQVLITTHSPELLDLFDADHVRLVQKSDGVSKVTRLDKDQRDLVKQRLSGLGEVMRVEGLRPGEPDTKEAEQ